MSDKKTSTTKKKKNSLINKKGKTPTKKQTPGSTHYVSNSDFYAAMKLFIADVNIAKEKGEARPMIPEYIAKCIMEIANRLSFKPNFMGYAYREEMISDAIENCITYIHNFNPDKSKNPFSYFTQICLFAFLRRIKREKRQVFLKYKKFEEMIAQDPNIAAHLRHFKTPGSNSNNGEPGTEPGHILTDDEFQSLPDFLRLSEREIEQFEKDKAAKK